MKRILAKRVEAFAAIDPDGNLHSVHTSSLKAAWANGYSSPGWRLVRLVPVDPAEQSVIRAAKKWWREENTLDEDHAAVKSLDRAVSKLLAKRKTK